MPADYIIEQPTLCMVTGVPGSGKSMLAGHLAYRIVNAAYESKDRIQNISPGKGAPPKSIP